MGISIRAYGRHRGVSDTAVHKAIKEGRITPENDGTIDPDKADIEWSKNSTGRKIGTSRKAFSTENTEEQPVGEPHPEKLSLDLEEPTQPISGSTTLLQARTVNEVIRAQTGKVKLSQLKGELIDKNQVMAHVFKLARTERDAWLNWPARVSNKIATTLAVDPHTLHHELDVAIRDYLSELSVINLDIS